jgi:hypothetical protein
MLGVTSRLAALSLASILGDDRPAFVSPAQPFKGFLHYRLHQPPSFPPTTSTTTVTNIAKSIAGITLRIGTCVAVVYLASATARTSRRIHSGAVGEVQFTGGGSGAALSLCRGGIPTLRTEHRSLHSQRAAILYIISFSSPERVPITRVISSDCNQRFVFTSFS